MMMRTATLAAIVLFVVPFALLVAQEDAGNSSSKATAKPISVDEARTRAKLLGSTITATLSAMHRNYFKDPADDAVPSRVLDDVFYRLGREENVNLHWLAVNAQAMSVDHKPRDQFERAAVKELTRGERTWEAVEKDVYRRVESIPLFGSCLKCHAPAPMNPNVARYAGLVIEVPLKPTEAAKTKR